MIGIIDYDAGNIKSVEKALQYLGQETVVSRAPQVGYAWDCSCFLRAVMRHREWKVLES